MSSSDPEMRDCPHCGRQPLDPRDTLNALSRRDNQTYVCSGCGLIEALRQSVGLDPWPTYPERENAS